MSKSYTPIWPEVTIFWGAGATASIGIPVTKKQGDYIFKLAEATDIKERVNSIDTISQNCKEELADLLIALGDDLESTLWNFKERELYAAKRLFRSTKMSEKEIKERIVVLRENYDWDALKRIIRISPKNSLFDLFNILDMYILSNQGMLVPHPSKKEKFFIENYRIKPARNCLVMLINIFLTCTYYNIIKKNPEKIKPYKDFVNVLGKIMIEEGKSFSSLSEKNYDKREFYLSSYAIISMNFEPILLWLLLDAYEEKNQHAPYIGSLPLKLHIDLGGIIGGRRDDEKGLKIRHSFNEAVVERINNPEYKNKEIIRIVKFYFPHGLSIWRECPRCGKIQMFYGNKKGDPSYHLFSPNILPSLKNLHPSTKEEEEAINEGRFDVMQCPYCGALTETQHTPMIMQTTYKVNTPPPIEEIQKDLKVCLENTKHIVLMGYSLPQDDVLWRSILATRRSFKERVFCSVVVGRSNENRWLYGKELKKFIESTESSNFGGRDTIKQAINIFGIDNVRAFTGGIPNVWANGSIEKNIKNLLYPKEILDFPPKRKFSNR